MMNGVGQMRSWRRIANVALAVLLALPLGLMLQGAQQEDWVLADALPPSGEAAALIMFAAMAIGPLARLSGGRSEAVRWLMRRRRNIGVVAFCYAALHLGIYVVDMGTLDLMLAEIDAPGIWTGWLALALMAAPAAASNDRAMRFLRGWWKPVQRLVYPVVALTLVHWAILMYGWREPLVHVAPMLALYAAAMIRPMFARKRTDR